MALGQVVNVIVCMPGMPTRVPCPAGQTTKVVQAYVIDPANAAHFETANQAFSAATAGQYFSFGLCTVLAVWLLGIAMGSIVNLVKRA
ncbi:hypothetical protein K4H28_03480 [Deefgea tanakiae]|uniref:Uncharacterized protein n=1 Tax=Deefgea tanakiae TaxID=2865840 RepID=A0ABX8Z7V4_9NEIS|nr:hypothetical protein [Deefgea tanakiae]QZA78490.1 hypothetical protein K4H28_03480 [Deefgea tanakiae]